MSPRDLHTLAVETLVFLGMVEGPRPIARARLFHAMQHRTAERLTDRGIRQGLAEARAKAFLPPILTSPGRNGESGGYYLGRTVEQIEAAIATEKHRARAICIGYAGLYRARRMMQQTIPPIQQTLLEPEDPRR